jgi:hypothetical protein
MCSNAGDRSACSPGDMTSQVAARARGKVREFSTFLSQGDPDETGLASLRGLHSCDYGTQCLAVLGRGTFQPAHAPLQNDMFSHGPTVFWEVPYLLCDPTGNTGQLFCPAPQRLRSAKVRLGEQDGGSGVHACHRHPWVSPDGRVLFGQATQKGSAQYAGHHEQESTRLCGTTSPKRLCRVRRHAWAGRPVRSGNQHQPSQ